jgi:outer membrane protein assembly factor BamB
MKKNLILFAALFLTSPLSVLADSDWLQWRGPSGNGVAADSADPPLQWRESQNIRWKIPIAGRGHSSPVVTGDLVVLTSASDTEQFVLGIDRASGDQRWQSVLHKGGIPTDLHRKNTAATATPTTDGRSIYVLFHNRGRLLLTALDREGREIWEKDTGPFHCDYRFGYGPSPTLHNGMLIVASEFAEGGYLAAFRSSDGSEVWRVDRKVKTSYSSPIVAHVAGRDQLLLSGANMLISLDPANGNLLWEVEGSSLATCGTMVWNEDTVFASGGFPNKETIAVRADGSGEILWRNTDKSYEQSLLYTDGHIYTLNDTGIAVCWNAETGERKWRERLGGPVSSSPILAGGRIYATNERGITFVFAPNPDRFEKLAEFQLGDEGFATPVFVGDMVFVRTAEQSGSRQEFLYCIGTGPGS